MKIRIPTKISRITVCNLLCFVVRIIFVWFAANNRAVNIIKMLAQ